MTIVLPVIDATGGRRISTLPHRYAVSPFGEYAHLPRSACWRSLGRREWLSVRALCGMSIGDPILTDTPAGPVCGSCLGRAEGVDPTRPDVAYRPRGMHWLPKKNCPGPRLDLYIEAADHRTGICLFCGITERIRGCGGPWYSGSTLTAHPHGGRGIACPDHGWKHLEFHSPELHPRPWCTYQLGSGLGRCNSWAKPFWILSDAHTCAPVIPEPPAVSSPWIEVNRRRTS